MLLFKKDGVIRMVDQLLLFKRFNPETTLIRFDDAMKNRILLKIFIYLLSAIDGFRFNTRYPVIVTTGSKVIELKWFVASLINEHTHRTSVLR